MTQKAFYNGGQVPAYGNERTAQDLATENKKLKAAIAQIKELCGTVNFSSHNQMREAIEGTLVVIESTNVL